MSQRAGSPGATDNGLLVGTDTSAPYSRSYSNLGAGSHSLTAKAADTLGQATTSAAAVLTVSAGTVSATRHYVYDDGMRLCKTVGKQENRGRKTGVRVQLL